MLNMRIIMCVHGTKACVLDNESTARTAHEAAKAIHAVSGNKRVFFGMFHAVTVASQELAELWMDKK